MNITFGLIDPLEKRVRKKLDRYDEISKRAIEDLRKWCADNDN